MSNRKGIRKSRKMDVWEKANGKCAHCGAESKRNRTVDHYIPKSQGGGMDRRNLLPLCKTCNKSRGSNKINPREYYKYAEEWAIEELLEYEREFKEKNGCH